MLNNKEFKQNLMLTECHQSERLKGAETGGCLHFMLVLSFGLGLLGCNNSTPTYREDLKSRAGIVCQPGDVDPKGEYICNQYYLGTSKDAGYRWDIGPNCP